MECMDIPQLWVKEDYCHKFMTESRVFCAKDKSYNRYDETSTKLIVVCSVLTIVSVLIQISKLPYPLTEINSPPNSAFSWYKPMNTARYLSSLTPDETLALVKRDIENSSLARDDDQDMFRNISTFKRFKGISGMLGDWKSPGAKTQIPKGKPGANEILNLNNLARNKLLVNVAKSNESHGIFLDVTLPETTIRNPRRPRRSIGGRRVSQLPILAFFAGLDHGRVRPILLKHWLDKDEDMRIKGHSQAKRDPLSTLQTNVKMLQKHFLWNAKPVPYDLFHMILHSIWSTRLKQIQLQQPQ
ncbi:hypothetical protein SASPL_123075 [Salvia splendens]|uniref:Uncharacterized protein n=1 Tax=Salvia splendens TaxID=180675 RepID=A0A8X8ZT29_SALSN|nr:hypothetical protein SASPL_123075 [Salvia splendens]